MSVSAKGRARGTTVWVSKSDSRIEALFTKQEDPRKCESCHAWFFRNGVVSNHFVLRSSYILENFTLKQGEQ